MKNLNHELIAGNFEAQHHSSFHPRLKPAQASPDKKKKNQASELIPTTSSAGNERIELIQPAEIQTRVTTSFTLDHANLSSWLNCLLHSCGFPLRTRLDICSFLIGAILLQCTHVLVLHSGLPSWCLLQEQRLHFFETLTAGLGKAEEDMDEHGNAEDTKHHVDLPLNVDESRRDEVA